MMSQHIEDLFEDKARKGDGSFAIAYAMMRLTAASDRLAVMVGRLGFDVTDHPGALEQIGMELGEIRKSLDPLVISASITGEINNG
jgi:hypothetical protein